MIKPPKTRRKNAKHSTPNPARSDELDSTRDPERRIEQAARNLETSLDLSHLGLTVLPESVFLIRQLLSLNLSGNLLNQLPESIGRLTQLQSLNVSHNQLMTLPDFNCELTLK
jgi:Leucine-rich repeat (LRR) protein